MAWRAPPDFGGMTIGPHEIKVDEAGHVDMSNIPPEAIHQVVAELASHKFENVPDPESADDPSGADGAQPQGGEATPGAPDTPATQEAETPVAAQGAA